MFHLFGLHWTSGPGEEDIEKKCGFQYNLIIIILEPSLNMKQS